MSVPDPTRTPPDPIETAVDAILDRRFGNLHLDELHREAQLRVIEDQGAAFAAVHANGWVLSHPDLPRDHTDCPDCGGTEFVRPVVDHSYQAGFISGRCRVCGREEAAWGWDHESDPCPGGRLGSWLPKETGNADR